MRKFGLLFRLPIFSFLYCALCAFRSDAQTVNPYEYDGISAQCHRKLLRQDFSNAERALGDVDFIRTRGTVGNGRLSVSYVYSQGKFDYPGRITFPMDLIGVENYQMSAEVAFGDLGNDTLVVNLGDAMYIRFSDSASITARSVDGSYQYSTQHSFLSRQRTNIRMRVYAGYGYLFINGQLLLRALPVPAASRNYLELTIQPRQEIIFYSVNATDLDHCHNYLSDLPVEMTTVAFSDEFRSNQSEWKLHQNRYYWSRILNGVYRSTKYPSDGTKYCAVLRRQLPQLSNQQDFEITYAINRVKFKRNGYEIYWGKYPNGWSRLRLFLDKKRITAGTVTVDRNGKYHHEYMGTVGCDDLRDRDYDVIKLRKIGQQYAVLVNGRMVHRFQSTCWWGNEIGIILWGPQEIDVGRMEVRLIDRPEAIYAAARELAEAKDYQNALQKLNRAIQLFPGNAAYKYLKMRILKSSGETGEFNNLAKWYRQKFPEDGFFHACEMERLASLTEKTEDYYNSVIGAMMMFPDNYEVFCESAMISLGAGNLETAEFMAGKARGLNAYDGRFHLVNAAIQIEKKDYHGALRSIATSIRKGNVKRETYFYRGMAHLALAMESGNGDHTHSARSDLQRARQMGKLDDRYWLQVGWTYLLDGNPLEACDCFQKAVLQRTENSDAFYQEKCGNFRIRKTISVGENMTSRVYLRKGEIFAIRASGKISLGSWAGSGGPNGIDGFRSYNIFSNARHGALLAEIGDDTAFLVGKGGTFQAPASGYLKFIINDQDAGNNYGAFKVDLAVYK